MKEEKRKSLCMGFHPRLGQDACLFKTIDSKEGKDKKQSPFTDFSSSPIAERQLLSTIFQLADIAREPPSIPKRKPIR